MTGKKKTSNSIKLRGNSFRKKERAVRSGCTVVVQWATAAEQIFCQGKIMVMNMQKRGDSRQ